MAAKRSLHYCWLAPIGGPAAGDRQSPNSPMRSKTPAIPWISSTSRSVSMLSTRRSRPNGNQNIKTFASASSNLQSPNMASDTKGFPLLAYLDELVEDLHKNVNKALRAFDADAIHDARVATRRLKAAMGLLESVISSEHRKPFGKVLKKLRRRLGPLRDLD